MSEEIKGISEDFQKQLNDLCKLATESGFLFFAAVDNSEIVFNSTNVEQGLHGDFLLDMAKGAYSHDREVKEGERKSDKKAK